MGNKISAYKDEDKKGYHFHCEGCDSAHGIYVEGKGVPIWGFNGNEDKPTFTPSILVKYQYSSPERNQLSKDYEKKHGKYPNEMPHDKLHICHSFVTDGSIRYLNDCTHHLKGKTVELLDF